MAAEAPRLLQQRDLPARLALGVLASLPLLLFWPALFGGKMLWGADIQTLELVFKTAAARAQARGQWPLWMPEILGGMPGIAASNLIFLHPFELAMRLLGLPPWMAFGLDAAAEVGLAGLGLWLFLRRLGRSQAGALLGALSWALSGTMLSLLYAGHVNNLKALAAIPWVFWGLHKGWQERRWLGYGLAGAALAWQVLGLGLQVFAYTLIALFAYMVWLAWAQPRSAGESIRWKPALLGVWVCGVFAFCLAAPQLLPSLQYKAHSWREGFSYEQFISWSFHPKEALGWIVPGFYGWREPWYHGDWPFCLTTEYFGLLPWALAFGAVAAAWRSEAWSARLKRPEAFFVLLALFAFLAGIGKHFPLHHVFYQLPVYSGFRTWTRFLAFLTFSVAVLAAFGWDALWELGTREAAKRGAQIFALLALAAALLALALSRSSIAAAAGPLAQKLGAGGVTEALALAQGSAFKAGSLALLLLAGFMVLGKLQGKGRLLLFLAVALHAADAGETAKRFLEFREPGPILQRPAWLSVLPDGQSGEPFRLFDVPGLWQQNSGALYGYETVQGYHGVQMAAPMQLAQALSQRQVEWISLMNGRYIAAPQDLKLPPAFTPLAQGPAYLYLNPYARERAFVVNQADAVADEAAAFTLLGQPGYDLLNRVTVDRPLALDAGPARSALRWQRARGNQLLLQAETDRRSLLVISQTWYPDWKASVDGVPVPLLKADGGALSALLLEPGKHQVELRYSARLLQASGLLALLSLLGMVWLWKWEDKGGRA